MDKRNYPSILNDYLRRVELRTINFDNASVAFVFANFRQLLEVNNLQSTYPTLNFYANWILHSKLDKSAVCIKLLSSLVTTITSVRQRKTFIDEVCKLLGEDVLKNEITALSRQFRIRKTLTKKAQFWRLVYAQILPEITYKPLVPVSHLNPITNITLSPSQSKRVAVPSYVVFWIHGKRGQQAGWSIALIPNGRPFRWVGLSKYTIKNEGVFYAP